MTARNPLSQRSKRPHAPRQEAEPYACPLVAGGIDVSLLRAAVQLIKGAVPTEASGNVTLQTVRQIAATGVTYISCGALTHSVHALDISLKIRTEISS